MSTDAADLLGMSNDQLAKVAAVVDAARAWVRVWDHQHSGKAGRSLIAAVRALDAEAVQ